MLAVGTLSLDRHISDNRHSALIMKIYPKKISIELLETVIIGVALILYVFLYTGDAVE